MDYVWFFNMLAYAEKIIGRYIAETSQFYRMILLLILRNLPSYLS